MNSNKKKFPENKYDSVTATLNEVIIEGIRDRKGKKIVQLDLREIEDAPAEFFIVCEGDSNVHVKSISDGIARRVREDRLIKPSHIEGSSDSRWVLMDYFDTIVHIFHPETREYYELEQLWGDAQTTYFEDL